MPAPPGRFCPHCGAAVMEQGQRFCVACGHLLAAAASAPRPGTVVSTLPDPTSRPVQSAAPPSPAPARLPPLTGAGGDAPASFPSPAPVSRSQTRVFTGLGVALSVAALLGIVWYLKFVFGTALSASQNVRQRQMVDACHREVMTQIVSRELGHPSVINRNDPAQQIFSSYSIENHTWDIRGNYPLEGQPQRLVPYVCVMQMEIVQGGAPNPNSATLKTFWLGQPQ